MGNASTMGGKVAIITGAAGGIGAAITRALGERGASVAAVDRDPDTLQTMTEKMIADGLRVEPFLCDVTASAQVRSTVDLIEQRLGQPDFLVNSAGVLRLAEARELTDEDWLSTIAVNTTGVFFMCRVVVDRMMRGSSGAIVTVASNAATTPRARMSAYAASKAASTMFTKCLGLEVAKHGIRCNVVAPGSTDTPMLHSMWGDEAGPQATIGGDPDTYRLGIPLRKLARPADIAEATVFLLSDQAAHITLHSLTVDGGASLGS